MVETTSARVRKPRTAKAEKTAAMILEAAETVLVDAGYHNFSMRRVAAAAGVTVGNLQYHFPNKELLIEAMLDGCIGRYLERFERIRSEAGADPKQQFAALVAGIFRDLNSEFTTRFFPELWSLANHDTQATLLMEQMYARYRLLLIDVIEQINPSLRASQVRQLALFFCASIEGHTVFVGHGKPWLKETDALIALATQSFLHLIEAPQ